MQQYKKCIVRNKDTHEIKEVFLYPLYKKLTNEFIQSLHIAYENIEIIELNVKWKDNSSFINIIDNTYATENINEYLDALEKFLKTCPNDLLQKINEKVLKETENQPNLFVSDLM